MNIRSIRFRLTLWYLAVLVAGMSIFGVTVWVSLQYAVLASLDQDLDQRGRGLERFLELESGGSDLAAVMEEAREYATGLPAGDTLRVWERMGN